MFLEISVLKPRLILNPLSANLSLASIFLEIFVFKPTLNLNTLNVNPKKWSNTLKQFLV